SNAMQPAKHDVMDWTSTRSWLNLPVGLSMGLAVITVAKAGAVLTYKVGTGLVVARRSDGSWSAPSA
ncbi:hypothetical protein EE612_040685, partial [Oryza sativa]